MVNDRGLGQGRGNSPRLTAIHQCRTLTRVRRKIKDFRQTKKTAGRHFHLTLVVVLAAGWELWKFVV